MAILAQVPEDPADSVQSADFRPGTRFFAPHYHDSVTGVRGSTFPSGPYTGISFPPSVTECFTLPSLAECVAHLDRPVQPFDPLPDLLRSPDRPTGRGMRPNEAPEADDDGADSGHRPDLLAGCGVRTGQPSGARRDDPAGPPAPEACLALAARARSRQRGRSVRPIRKRSIECAARRPSQIAQTTKD